MTDYRKLYPSKFLRAVDLDEKEHTVTIIKIVEKDVVDPKSKKTQPILYFKGGTKGLGTNPTNAASIAEIHGREYEGWVGKKIVLYPTKCKGVEGKIVDCIRIKRPAK